MEVINGKERVAKKEHTCDWCGGVIKPGEKYDWSSNKHDGDLYEWKTHSHCSAVASHYDMYDLCDDGLTSDDFIEQLHEIFFDEFSSAELSKLLYDKLENKRHMEAARVQNLKEPE